MEYDRTQENAVQQEACRKVKQMAELMKHFRIKYYPDFQKISEEDKQTYNEAKGRMMQVATQNGLDRLQVSLITDMINKYGNDEPNSELKENDNNQLTSTQALDAYRGAIDAEKDALTKGKIGKAKKCQLIASKYYDQLVEGDQKRAIEYKRGLFSELHIPQNSVKENNEQMMEKLKGCFRPKDAKARKEFTKLFAELQKEQPQTVTEKASNKAVALEF